MDKYYIVSNHKKDQDLSVTSRTAEILRQNGKQVQIFYTNAEGKVELNAPGTDAAGCVFTIGGDGTLIQAARGLVGSKIPVLGINMGTLGYLTEVDVQNLETALEQVQSGSYMIEERMMLEGDLPDGRRDVALNDIVVTRHGSVKIIYFNLYVNGQFLNSYQADGMIISTPTGSTAYNLSAGGPIVEPTASMILVTPICTHALNNRTIVLSADDEIEIEIAEGRGIDTEKAEAAFDGEDIALLKTGDKIKVRKADVVTRLVKLSKVSFLETLREKMKGN